MLVFSPWTIAHAHSKKKKQSKFQNFKIFNFKIFLFVLFFVEANKKVIVYFLAIETTLSLLYVKELGADFIMLNADSSFVDTVFGGMKKAVFSPPVNACFSPPVNVLFTRGLQEFPTVATRDCWRVVNGSLFGGSELFNETLLVPPTDDDEDDDDSRLLDQLDDDDEIDEFACDFQTIVQESNGVWKRAEQ